MTSTPSSKLRVALAAAPLLLADSLRSLLESYADVTVILDDVAEVPGSPFDIAIITPTAPRIPADITIVLDDTPDSRGGGTMLGVDGAPSGRLDDLTSVLCFVEHERGAIVRNIDADPNDR